MSDDHSRRTFLKGIGAAVGALTFGTRTVEASRASNRFIVDASTVEDMEGMREDMEVIYDFRGRIEYVVVRGAESDMPEGVSYAADLDIEIDVPQEEGMGMDAREAEEPFLDLQWDKQEQNITEVHEDATGDGARIGVIDDGVLGAGDRDIVGGLDGHPDLPNVRSDLSVNFTDDGNGPGPLNDDHGTHCAGTAAAAANGVGVVGVAPDAEVVDLRVFSGRGASFADIAAAIFVGSLPEDETFTFTRGPENDTETVTVRGADCDVLNLSLSTAPLLPVNKPPEEIGPDDDPDGDGPIVPVNAEGLAVLIAFNNSLGNFATTSGTLPVASAGNDGINLDTTYDEAITGTLGGIDFDGSPVNLPCEADGFMSIGAAGPIGFGWPLTSDEDDDDDEEDDDDEGSTTVAGLTIEDPIDIELPTEEPAFYTNYGADAVDVTAGGGNADIDAIGSGTPWFVDLVFNTGIANLDDGASEDTVLDTYVPGYAFKAGTSFSAPNVAGLAALLFGLGDDPSPREVRDTIESTARPLPVGRAGETTAPGADVNVANDGTFDGDQPSNPGSAPGPFRADTYRGEGHIDVSTALERLSDDDDEDDEDEEEDDNGSGNRSGDE